MTQCSTPNRWEGSAVTCLSKPSRLATRKTLIPEKATGRELSTDSRRPPGDKRPRTESIPTQRSLHCDSLSPGRRE
jgi:hypothetical protein